ncbi:MAG: 4-(cytidine 5'-diphospho)-2-C-methyl-D-erythritol kinase [Betaproteobacteria bacterium]|nr:4-(cytidine 5'-diphospho)-2-C-methyl-D-erythritol kinase [Betaproteobacteria bacterium]
MASEFSCTGYPAPAKLNLFLHVLGRRADGYHELQTVFRFLDAGDRLDIRVRADGDIVRSNAVAGLPAETDLCVRAARLLRGRTGTHLGAEIRLDKRLPLGGGLGGGSSDAATVLIVLNRLWGLDLTRGQLMAIALELGADVPVFVFGESAWGEGIGERLTPIALPGAWYVVLVPPVSVSTTAVFNDAELTRNSNRIKMSAFFAGGVRNDLEPVVCRLYPAIRDYLDWLRRQAPARLTGSGACVFASFEDEQKAHQVFAARPPHMQGFVAQGSDHHPLRGMTLGSRQAG